MRTEIRAALAAASLIAILALAAAACGGDESAGEEAAGPEPFDLALDFFVNPDHVGIYQGIADGEFAAEGLEVRPRVPSDPSAPIKQVAAGRVDLAISYEPEVMLAREAGLDVVAVAALVDEPLTSLISLPDAGIEGPADLAGKTVVTAGIPYQAAYLDTILADAGVDPSSVDRVDVGLNLLQPVISGRADAMLGGFRNIEGVDLAERDLDPRVEPVDELGIPSYDELVLVASAERVREDPDAIRSFLAALQRGTDSAAADPEAATDAVLEAGDALDPELTAAEVEATIPLLSGAADEPFGRLDAAEWQRFGRFLAEQGQIDQAPGADELINNELLPEGKGGGG